MQCHATIAVTGHFFEELCDFGVTFGAPHRPHLGAILGIHAGKSSGTTAPAMGEPGSRLRARGVNPITHRRRMHLQVGTGGLDPITH